MEQGTRILVMHHVKTGASRDVRGDELALRVGVLTEADREAAERDGGLPGAAVEGRYYGSGVTRVGRLALGEEVLVRDESAETWWLAEREH